MRLGDLGFDEHAEQVYLRCLQLRRVRIDELHEKTRLAAADVEAVLGTLSGWGLVLCSGDEVRAADPTTAWESLIEEKLAELRARARDWESARSLVPLFAKEFGAGDGDAHEAEIYQIEGLDGIRKKLDDLSFFAHQEVIGLQPGGPWSAETIDAARPLDLRCLQRGLKMRTVVLSAALADRLTRSYLLELVALGAEIRSVEGPLERLIVYDRRTAVAPLDPDDSRHGAIVVNQPGLVSSMIRLFERVWDRATPLEMSQEGWPVQVLSPVERQVLQLMCIVDKDEVGARELAVSARTYRRHVADLMARLGATNRFQAAVLAKDRGWI